MILPGHLKSKDFQNKVGAQGLMKLFECDSEDELRSKLTGKIAIQLLHEGLKFAYTVT